MKSNISTKPRLDILDLASFRLLVDGSLDTAYHKWIEYAARVDPEYHVLIERMNAFISRGGKRWRPYLTYLGYVGYGGNSVEAILPIASAQEVYHNAWLIYDDIIDHDLSRYNGPNLAGTYLDDFKQSHPPVEAKHLASAMAILAGNINTAIATDLILGANFDAEAKVRALQLQQRVIMELAGGEQLDVILAASGLDEVSEERLLRVCRYKAANYTFEAPLQIGAILAGASSDVVSAISHIAVPIGIAFQITDDILGTFGDEEEIGKPVLSDLREGKRTLLIVEALAKADQSEAKLIHHALGNPEATLGDLEAVREIIISTGALEYTQRLARKEIEQALELLPSLGLLPAVESVLVSLAQSTVSRHA